MTSDGPTDETGTGARVLDAREIDGPPFGAIDDALGDLSSGERLEVVNSFEPTPLYDVLDRRGFEYEVEENDGEWRVRIHRP